MKEEGGIFVIVKAGFLREHSERLNVLFVQNGNYCCGSLSLTFQLLD